MPMDSQDKKIVKYYQNKHVIHAFYNAFNGIYHAFVQERNLKIHACVTAMVLILGLFVNISMIEWVILMMMIAIVVGFELMNTAIEACVDLIVGDEWHSLAKVAKDVAAGAVMFSTVCAIIMGIVIFVPKLWTLLLK